MKIKIIKERYVELTKLVDISQFHTFVDLKEAMLSYLGDSHRYLERYFCVIYNDFIMKDDNLIKTYRFAEDSVIYISQLENFITNNQIVLDMLVVTGDVADLMHLIVDRNATLEQVMGETETDRIRMWTVGGDLLNTDTIVSDIVTERGYLKIIVSWNPGDAHLSFENCCECHDRYLINEFWWIFAWDKVRQKNNSFLTEDFITSVKGLQETVTLVMTKDEKFSQSLSSLPVAFVNSKILFCNALGLRVIDLFRKFFMKNDHFGYEVDFFNINGKLHVALYFAILDYVDTRESLPGLDTDSDVRLADIIQVAMDYWTKHTGNWEDRMRRLWNSILMRERSDYELGCMWSLGIKMHGLINVKINASGLTFFRLPKSVETVLDAKKFIARTIGMPAQDMLLINSRSGKEPSNTEALERDQLTRAKGVPQYFFEIVLRLDNIDALKMLGSGAFGEVLLCQNKISKEQFVLKKQLAKTGNLYRDISIHSRFAECSNVTKCTGLYSDKQMICLATEYLPGGSLTSFLEQMKYLSEEMTAKIAYQLLIQLAEIHSMKVIHRDIKCDNIVLDDELNAKFIDFGLSKCMDGLTHDELMTNLKAYKAGTMPYMALELLNKQPYTEKIDIWSFGVVVTEMIAGVQHHTDITAVRAVIKIMRTKKIEFHPPQPISDELSEFIDMCLHPDPNKRSSCTELLNSRFIRKHNSEDQGPGSS